MIGSSVYYCVRDKSHVSGGSNQKTPHIKSCEYLPQALYISQAPTIHFDTLANFDSEQAS